MIQDVIYYGIFIDEMSKKKLMQLVPETAYKVFCDHMTLAHRSTFTDEVVNICNDMLGENVTMTATTIGVSDDAMAVGIETDCFSVNEHKHITLCTMTPMSKPVQSNYIENWYRLDEPIVLNGTVMAFTKNGLVKENNRYWAMGKKLIRLTESDLHRIVKESVKRILKEEKLEWVRQEVEGPKLKKVPGGVRYPDGEVLVGVDTPLTRWHSDYESNQYVEEGANSKWSLRLPKKNCKKVADKPVRKDKYPFVDCQYEKIY